jgi:tetratricopeptide (TPR) repeat protein
MARMRFRALLDLPPRSPLLLCGGVAIVAAIASVAITIAVRRPAPPPPALASALAPDPQVVRYRHPIARAGQDAPAADGDLAGDIAALAARTATPVGSPMDFAALADLYLRRAKLTGDRKDYDASEAAAKRSLELMSTQNGAVLVLAGLASARHDFRRAVELARQHNQGRSTGALMALATAHLALGEHAEASAAAEGLVTALPDAAAYLMRALVMEAQGRDTEAAFDFARAAAADEPGDLQEPARRRALWGQFLIRRGELAGARLVIDEALRIAPGHPLALQQDGELLLRTGRAKEARARFEQAFAASRQVRYLIDQARALEVGGDRPGAGALRGQVEKLVRPELSEGGLGHRLDLAEVLIDRGAPEDLSEATALAREEVSRRPSAIARFQLARALALTGNPGEALRQVQAALTLGAREAQICELASRLEKQRGNAARSALYAREATRLDPGASGWRKAGLP